MDRLSDAFEQTTVAQLRYLLGRGAELARCVQQLAVDGASHEGDKLHELTCISGLAAQLGFMLDHCATLSGMPVKLGDAEDWLLAVYPQSGAD